MKTLLKFAFIILVSIGIFSCGTQAEPSGNDFVGENVRFATEQYGIQVKLIEESGKVLNPKTIQNGKIRYISPQEWTSGFFPGSMWYL